MTGYLIIEVTRAHVTSITGKPVITCHGGEMKQRAFEDIMAALIARCKSAG
jgi:hypothetical protein